MAMSSLRAKNVDSVSVPKSKKKQTKVVNFFMGNIFGFFSTLKLSCSSIVLYTKVHYQTRLAEP